MIVVTEKGPIDRLPPGADVTGIYRGDTLRRLIEEGYLTDTEAQVKKAASKSKRKTDKNNVPVVDDVTDAEGEDENGSD